MARQRIPPRRPERRSDPPPVAAQPPARGLGRAQGSRESAPAEELPTRTTVPPPARLCEHCGKIAVPVVCGRCWSVEGCRECMPLGKCELCSKEVDG
jgi:hypothetical protein